MKKIICFITLLYCVSSVFAQRGGLKSNYIDKKNAYKINLLSPIRSTINLSWNHLLSPLSSFQVTVAYMDFDSYGDTYSSGNSSTFIGSTYVTTSSIVQNQQTQGIAIMPEYRFMLNGRGLSGFYVSPFLRYAYCNYKYNEVVSIYTGGWASSLTYYSSSTQQINYHSAGIGLVLGKQYLFKNTCVIDFFGGPVYSLLLHASNGATQTDDIQIGTRLSRSYLNGYGIRMGVTFGIVR